MALRIRKDGRVLCAAMHAEEPGDTYLDDGLHYLLSAERKLLVTEPMERHKLRGEWWWSGNVPGDVAPEAFYLRPNDQAEIASRKDIRMKAQTAQELLKQWEAVKQDRAYRQDCLEHTGPGESPYTRGQEEAWNMREHCLSRTLLASMDELAPLLERQLC